MVRIAAAADIHASDVSRERVERAFAELEGEPPGIYTYLGCDRLATPIAENGADLVLHGHAHAGSFEGCIGDIPVYNVAVHVTGRNFWIFELDGSGVRRGGEVVEVREPPQ